MHRVELKVPTAPEEWRLKEEFVPNAPCGVESGKSVHRAPPTGKSVPNAPCGVERNVKKKVN